MHTWLDRSSAAVILIAAGAAWSEPSAIEGLPFRIGSLDSAGLRAAGPRLFFSAAEVERAGSRMRNDAAYRPIVERLMKAADEALGVKVEPLDESWWDTDKDKPWQETYPQVFEKTWLEPNRYARPAATLATAWLLTGEPRYADKAVELLMNVAPFSYRMEHYDVGMNYSIWGVEVLKAYDVLMPRMSREQREALDGCMSRLAWAVARNDVYWIDNNIGGGINNHLAWHKAMLGLLGLFYGRAEVVDYCMHGRRGLVSLLEDGLLDDGLWCESSLNYQFAAIAPMLVLADCQARMGHRPALGAMTLGNGRTLKQSYDAMFNVLAPNGLIPPIGDCYGNHQKLWDIPLYETCWSLWSDAEYAWLIRQSARPTSRLLFAPAVPEDAPAPRIGTLLLPEHGYAMLRSHRDAAYWSDEAQMAFLTYDRSGVHANADKLSLMLFGQGRMLLSDVEARTTTQAHSFSSRIQGQLNRGGLSQNTVMIDGCDQRCSSEMLRLIEFRDLPDEKRVTAADVTGVLYDGVRQMRTVAMTPDYVLDLFQVDCGGQERQIDWIAHVLDEHATMPPAANPALAGCEPFELPTESPWHWLRDARSFVPDGAVRLEWHGGDARVRLHMLAPGAGRVILCGYPATDEQAPPTIPMTIVRTHAARAVFAAVWLVGDGVGRVELKPLPPHDGQLVYEVTADGKPRRHLLGGL